VHSFAVRLILEKEGQLLFLLQTQKNGGGFSLVGGNVESREFAREALCREAKEEAGITIEPADLNLIHVLHRHKLRKNEELLVLYFKATRFLGEPNSLEPKKFSDVRWFPIDNLPAEVSKPTLHVLKHIRAGEIYSEFPTRSQAMAFWEQVNDGWNNGMSGI
jgi:8-oxo-dGTP diphosphatase